MESKKFFWQIGKVSLIVAAFIVSLGFASHRQSVMPCSGVLINVYDSTGTGFIDRNDIHQIIQNKFGRLEGKPVASINISLLEKIINNNPFVREAEVFSTVDGKVNIVVKQRLPVLRVINNNNESFYVDGDGVFMPPSEKFTARVPVANGYIYDRQNENYVRFFSNADSSTVKTTVEKLFNIIQYTSKNKFWNDEIEQLYVNANGDIELVPRVGDHTIVVGNDEDLDEKFTKLLAFYKETLDEGGWNHYSVINLKYKDQVVCTKK
jgi:cell division protein FtsQ